MIRFLQFQLFFMVLTATTKHVLSTNCATDPPLDPSSPPSDPKNGYQEWASTSAASYDNSMYVPKKSDPCDGMAFHWKISSNKLKVAVAVHASGWSAIGFSETGGMRGADLVYYEAKANRLVDAYVKDGYVKPTDDLIQDWALIGSTKTDDGIIIFEAERDLDTGDTVHDREILDDSGPEFPDHRLIGAWGESETIGYHISDRITTSVQLFTGGEGSGNAYENFKDQMAKLSEGSIKFGLNNYEIPDDEVTTYYDECFSTNALIEAGLLEDLSSDTHILGFEFHIDETSVKYAHHIVVYGHMTEYNQIPNYCFRWSRVPVMAWAPGSDFYHFPEGGGLQIGNVPGSFNAFTIEYHFDNIDLDKNIIDNGSGVEFFYTNQPVQNEIGMFVVGDPNVQLAFGSKAAVGRGKTMHTFTCSSACSEQVFQDDEVNIIYEGHHMHQIGKRMTNELFRGDTLVNNAIVDFWDFDQSGVYNVKQTPYKMKKGDYFRTTCYYEDFKDTVFGLASNEEMCMTFLYYYPKQPFFFGCGIDFDDACEAMHTKETLSSDSNFDREFGMPGQSKSPTKSPTESPPTGTPPTGTPPTGSPPTGTPPTGSPPTSTPPTGTPPTGTPPTGSPPTGTPPTDSPPSGAEDDKDAKGESSSTTFQTTFSIVISFLAAMVSLMD